MRINIATTASSNGQLKNFEKLNPYAFTVKLPTGSYFWTMSFSICMTVERGHPVVHRTFGKDFMLAHWPSKIAVKWPNYVIIALQRYHEAADFITKRSLISETHGRKFRKLLGPWPELTTFAFGVRNLARNFENLHTKKSNFNWIDYSNLIYRF